MKIKLSLNLEKSVDVILPIRPKENGEKIEDYIKYDILDRKEEIIEAIRENLGLNNVCFESIKVRNFYNE